MPLRNFLFQILVGGGDDPHVHRDRLGSADRGEALFVERAQDFGLRLQAHVADFVQEQRAAIGLLELAVLIGGGAGKCSLAVSEQLALDRVFGNGGAIYLDKHFILAQAEGMDGVRDQFLAGARLAINQDASVGGAMRKFAGAALSSGRCRR